MRIIVDVNEVRSGLPALLAASWHSVEVRRLPAGDAAVGPQVLIERKTIDDLVASLADGRLFRQACRLASGATRPILIQEGDEGALEHRVDPGAYRGAILSLSVGFRIPVLKTRDVEDTADVIRHMAAQESKRESRRRRRAHAVVPSARRQSVARQRLPAPAIEVLCALPGVGPRRARALAAHAGSLCELTRFSVRDLMAVPGIGPDTAAGIVDALREHRSDETSRAHADRSDAAAAS